eukprot:TRINITY_DN6780_c0_g3_i4.p1 TRINITY_DN6780_c0_g3~~TRINITY_DN6780_c0_g3_i4.p1  ORF type:complete len:1099 (-),score=113.84 TRINITY_DN6780_c0_g3_i4:2343-5639(-)
MCIRDRAFDTSTFRGKRILVISILGPQNSGKSTLLNFIFGCDFNISDGRCTRGVYGTLVSSPMPQYDYFLIVDSEGLQSVEKGDANYDRRLILLCFAISHIIIINVKDQITETLKAMIEVCAHSLKEMNVTKVTTPFIFFVLNQKADPNLKNFQQDMQKILVDFSENKLGKVMKVNDTNFVGLPSAFTSNSIVLEFNSKEIMWKYLTTAPEFIEHVSNLGSKIGIKVEESLKASTFNLDLPQFIDISYAVFETIVKCPIFTSYNTIEESRIQKRIDALLTEELSKIFRSTTITEIFDKIVKWNKYTGVNEINLFIKSAKDAVFPKLSQLFEDLEAPSYLRKKKELELHEFLKTVSQDWINWLEILLFQKEIQGASSNLHSYLLKELRELKKMGTPLTDSLFNQVWNKIVEEIQKSCDSCLREENYLLLLYSTYSLFEKQKDGNFFLFRQQVGKSDFEWNKDSFAILPTIPTNSTMLTNTNPRQAVFLKTNLLLQKITGVRARLTATKALLRNTPTKKMQKALQDLEVTTREAFPSGWRHELSLTDIVLHANSKKQDVGETKCMRLFNLLCGCFRRSSLVSRDEFLPFIMPIMSDIIKSSFQSEVFVQKLKKIVSEKKGKNWDPHFLSCDVIKNLVSNVEQELLIPCNAELAFFGHCLSDLTRDILHIRIMSILFEDVQTNLNLQRKDLITQLNKIAPVQKSIFTSLLNGSSTDEDVANDFTNAYASILKDHIRPAVQKEFETEITNILMNTNRNEMIKKLEETLENLTEDEMYQFFMNGNQFVNKKFDEKWAKDRELLEKKINSSLQTGVKYFTSLIDCADEALKRLKDMNLDGYESYFLFNSSPSKAKSSKSPTVLSLPHEKAGFQYLFDLILKAQTANTLQVDNWTITATFKTFSLRTLLSPENQNFITQAREKVNLKCIKNLQVFLEKICQNLEKKKSEFISQKFTMDDLDRDVNLISKLIQKGHGCSEKCPCCNKVCDIEHDEQEGLHSCVTGHNLHALAGFTYKKTDQPLIDFAENTRTFKGEDGLFAKPDGNLETWEDFCQHYPQWNWKMKITDEKKKRQERINRCWLRIGPRVCANYQGQGKKIKFVQSNH